MKREDIEITAPVGSYESLMAAIQAGANSVYFGIDKLNMRAASSVNFTLDDLAKLTEITRQNQLNSYITLNSVVYNDEIELVKTIIDSAKNNGVTGIIASDFAVIRYAASIGVEVHCSTQCNISNIEAVKFFSQFADVMVLARELNLEQVKYITESIEKENIKGPSGKKVRIEIFAHGALCMAISGKCYLSLHNMNSSANRGECLQLCRRPYKVQSSKFKVQSSENNEFNSKYLVTDKDGGFELEIDNEYIMSPKDLCTIDFLDKILLAGVRILKIEGRGRSPEYVKIVAQCYKEAVESICEETYTEDKITHWKQKLGSVYNRGFWDGYYLGRKMGEWTEKYGSQATTKKIYIGKITNYFTDLKVAEIKIETHSISVGDKYYIMGPSTGVYEDTVKEIRVDLAKVDSANKGDLCSIPVDTFLRRSDKLYKVVSNE